jgi:uncharacterized protein (TIGR03067 family)
MIPTLVSLALALAAPDPKDPKGSILGDWVAHKVLLGSEDRSPRAGEDPITFGFTADGKMTVRQGFRGEGSPAGRYTLDPTKDPPAIDFVPNPDRKEPTFHGIYKVEGDTLTLCWGRPPGAARPKKFESTAESPTTLYVCRRAKK